MRSTILFSAVLAMALTACTVQQRDLSELPADETERAMLCFASAHFFRRHAEEGGQPPAEIARRMELEAEMRSVTNFNDLWRGLQTNEPLLNASIQPYSNGGDWLVSLNRCKKGYDLGDPEALPALPGDPATRLMACAISVSWPDRRGQGTSVYPLVDSQGFYFVAKLLSEHGRDALAAQNNLMSQTASEVLRGGAVSAFARTCIEENPLAAEGGTVALPDEPELQVAICNTAGSALVDVDAPVKQRQTYMPRLLRLATASDREVAPRDWDAVNALFLDTSPQIAELGPASSIFEACERTYAPAA